MSQVYPGSKYPIVCMEFRYFINASGTSQTQHHVKGAKGRNELRVENNVKRVYGRAVQLVGAESAEACTGKAGAGALVK